MIFLVHSNNWKRMYAEEIIPIVFGQYVLHKRRKYPENVSSVSLFSPSRGFQQPYHTLTVSNIGVVATNA